MKNTIFDLSENQVRFIVEQLKIKYFKDEAPSFPVIEITPASVNYDFVKRLLLTLTQVNNNYRTDILNLIKESERSVHDNQVTTMDPSTGSIYITGMLLLFNLLDPIVKARLASSEKVNPLELSSNILKNPLHKIESQVQNLTTQVENLNRKQSLYGKIKNRVDVVILTPVRIENDAARKHLKNIIPIFDKQSNTFYEVGKFNELTIALRRTEQGNYASAIETQQAISFFNPKAIIMLGIAGGIKKVKLGDIVICGRVSSYEAGKITKDGWLSREKGGDFDSHLREVAKSLINNTNWVSRKFFPPKPQHVKYGVIASGEKVITDTKVHPEIFKMVQASCEDAIAVDMESVGFYVSLDKYRDKVRGIVIRSISDLLDDKEETYGKSYRAEAADNASAFTFELISQLDFSVNSFYSNIEGFNPEHTVNYIDNSQTGTKNIHIEKGGYFEDSHGTINIY